MKQVIQTAKAPEPIGCYSQAIRVGSTVYLSGQIPLDPQSGLLVEGDFRGQVEQVFKNIKAVVEAASGSLAQVVKLTIYLKDLSHFQIVNEVMAEYFQKPYPARTTIAVLDLPKQASIEIEALLVLN